MYLRKLLAFTLIELLVVISIISLLMAITMPSLGRSREQARRAVCMANLRSIGQCLFLYATDNDEKIVPGDCRIAWDVWNFKTQDEDSNDPECQPVNLGHLLSSEKLYVPTSDRHVFFCPSSRTYKGERPYEGFVSGWGKSYSRASITYMLNTSLSGLGNFVQQGDRAVLSHGDKVNFLLGDCSVQVFNVKPLVFDVQYPKPEMLHEVSARYGVCFPVSMLHKWFEEGEVDLPEAREYLADPMAWAESHATESTNKPVLIANVGNKSLVSDVVGVWGGEITMPSPPG